MFLDVRTIIFLTALTALTMSATMFITLRLRTGTARRAMIIWAGGCALQGIGWLLLGLRGNIPTFATIVVGNMLVISSYFFNYLALQNFKNKPAHIKMPLAIIFATALLLVFFTYITNDVAARVLVTTMAGFVLGCFPVYSLLFSGFRPLPSSHIFTAVVLSSGLPVAVFRIFYILLFAPDFSGLFPDNPAQIAIFVTLYLSIVLATFGFTLMVNDKYNAELQQALAEVKTLSGLLPICSYCKSIRDDQNYWQRIDTYISLNTDTKFTHGICPSCYETELKPQIEAFRNSRN